MGIAERKEREKERRYNEIIDAAEKIFFNKGIENSTMDDVAKKAELSKGTIYLYFKSKEDLHFAISLRGMDVMTKMLLEAFDEKHTGAENALNIGRAYIQFFNDHRDYYNAMMSFAASHLKNVAEDKKGRIMDEDSPLMVFIKVIEKGKADKTIRADIPSMELAVMLWTNMYGLLQFAVYKAELLDMLKINMDNMLMNYFKLLQDGMIKNIKLF